jgi:hypothetical protein
MMGGVEVLPVKAEGRGAVRDEDLELAVRRIRSVSRLAGGRVQFAHVKITAPAHPAAGRPVLAQASLRAHGRMIHTHATGATLREAIGRMTDQLRVQLERVTAPRLEWRRHRHQHQRSVA